MIRTTLFFILTISCSWISSLAFAQSFPEADLIIDPEDYNTASPQEWLNYNPMLHFTAMSEPGAFFQLQSEEGKLSAFTVFRTSTPELEQVIWSLHAESGFEEILTNRRVVNLKTGGMIGYQLRNSAFPHATHYLRKDRATAGQMLEFHLGDYGGGRTDIPAGQLHGIIGETRLFSTLLSKQERQIMNTYYALKYGLHLQHWQEYGYRSSQDELLWSAPNEYRFRITGVGRDDQTGLYQKQSTSAYAPDLLSVALGEHAATNRDNTATLPDYSFLLWADNNEELVLGQDKGIGKITARRWLFSPKGNFVAQPFSVRINQRRWLTPPKAGEQLWLIVNEHPPGDFTPEQTSFYSARSVVEGMATFSGIDFSGGHDFILTFSAGPPMMPLLWADTSFCDSQTTGSLTIGVVGGNPPYQFRLLDESGKELQVWPANASQAYRTIPLPYAAYQLEITDASGHVVRKSVRPCGREGDSEPPTALIAQHYLYPNPTADGDFRLVLRLREPSPVQVSILNVQGQLISTQLVGWDSYLEYSGYLPASGQYFLQITAGQESLTFPIIRS